MGLVKEFKEFAMRGNVLDMAVGIILGAAFGKIVNSLVTDVIMPPIGYVVSGVDFAKLSLSITPPTEGAQPIVIGYGKLINEIITFTIVAFSVFLLIKGMNRMTRKKAADADVPATPPPPAKEVVLLEEIRDLLKAR